MRVWHQQNMQILDAIYVTWSIQTLHLRTNCILTSLCIKGKFGLTKKLQQWYNRFQSSHNLGYQLPHVVCCYTCCCLRTKLFDLYKTDTQTSNLQTWIQYLFNLCTTQIWQSATSATSSQQAAACPYGPSQNDRAIQRDPIFIFVF